MVAGHQVLWKKEIEATLPIVGKMAKTVRGGDDPAPGGPVDETVTLSARGSER